MNTRCVLLSAGLAALAGAAWPATIWAQRASDYTIDVTKPEGIVSRRYSMHQRVRVSIQGLNPFAANYRINVYERAYSDSAISQFLAGLGISVPAASPPPAQVSGSRTAATTARAGFAALLDPAGAEAARRGCSGTACVYIDSAVFALRQYDSLLDTLRIMDEQDVGIRFQYQTIRSERATQDSVMADIRAVVGVLQARASSLHHGLAVRQRATDIVARVAYLRPRLEPCGPTGVCAALDAIKAQQAGLMTWTGWRDSMLARDEQVLPALDAAVAQAGVLFTQVFEVGDYDYPTTVDIQVLRQPLGPLNFAYLAGQLPEATGGPVPKTSSPPTPSADTGFAGGWRSVGAPRLHFGQRRRIGLSGALVFAIGPETNTYGTAKLDTTGTSITVSRHEHQWVPLLTLTARAVGFDVFRVGCSLNFIAGVTPSVTTRQTYFFGGGLAVADERIAIIVGWLSLPTQDLVPPSKVGDYLVTGQAVAPTQETRVGRLAVGLNLRPF